MSEGLPGPLKFAVKNFRKKLIIMKVQLVFSPSLVDNPDQVLSSNMSPPLGILYIASYLRSKISGIEIKVTDGCKIGYNNTRRDILQFEPDVLGISFYTTMAAGAVKLTEEVKKILPRTIIVMGGSHATALPEDTIRKSKCDIVVVGEGEEAFYQIIKVCKDGKNNAKLQNIPGVWIIERNGYDIKICQNTPANFIKSLNDIPFPAWDLIDLKQYTGYYFSKQSPEAPMFFARGCPYSCTFCSNAVWKSSTPALRLRSPKNIADEMEYLNKHFGVREVFDQSDEFNNSLKHAIEVCKEIKERNLNMTWKAQLRVKPFTEELARLMAEAGCWYVHLGIESGNQETVTGVQKHIMLSDVGETCRLLRKYNIKILALFMIYNVWEENGHLRIEDSRMCENTYKFAYNLIKNKLVNYVSWSVTTPYPGSKLYDIACRQKIIKKELLTNLEAWQRQDIFMMNLPGISRREQAMTKLKGDILKSIIVLKNMDFKLKNIPFIIKRAIFNLRQIFRRTS